MADVVAVSSKLNSSFRITE